MQEQLKKRLVGAAVLIALAVIFLPMLLEGPSRMENSVLQGNIPEMPEKPANMINIPLQVPPPFEELEKAPAPARAEPPAARGTVEAKVKQPSASPVAETGSPPAKVVPVSPAGLAQKKETRLTQGWAVQVGSFSTQANANRLRDELRGKGFPAYVEEVKLNSGASYRVRVGPMSGRTDAEAVQAKLAAVEMRGIVVTHP